MAKTRTRPWDPIRGLDTAEEIVGYVDEALALDDLQLFEVVLKDIGRVAERYKVQKEDIIRVVERVAIESEKSKSTRIVLSRHVLGVKGFRMLWRLSGLERSATVTILLNLPK